MFCLQSCIKNPEPAFSYVPSDRPETGEEIQFINESLDASHFYWDFDNGRTSDEEMPVEVFSLPGTYTITLVAENMFRVDSIKEDVLIYPPTILQFYFYDFDGIPISSAQVELYNTASDAMSFTNQVKSGSSNVYGMTKFSNLEPKQYYLWMEKTDNSGGGYFTGGYVGPLKQNQINTYITFVDYYESGKKKAGLKMNFIPLIQSEISNELKNQNIRNSSRLQ